MARRAPAGARAATPKGVPAASSCWAPGSASSRAVIAAMAEPSRNPAHAHGRAIVTGAVAAMMAMLEALETEARHWCRDRGIDPDGSAPGIMVGPLGFAPEKYWIRRATVIPAKAGIH